MWWRTLPGGQCSEAGVEAAVREVEEVGWLWEAVAEVASAARVRVRWWRCRVQGGLGVVEAARAPPWTRQQGR